MCLCAVIIDNLWQSLQQKRGRGSVYYNALCCFVSCVCACLHVCACVPCKSITFRCSSELQLPVTHICVCVPGLMTTLSASSEMQTPALTTQFLMGPPVKKRGRPPIRKLEFQSHYMEPMLPLKVPKKRGRKPGFKVCAGFKLLFPSALTSTGSHVELVLVARYHNKVCLTSYNKLCVTVDCYCVCSCTQCMENNI